MATELYTNDPSTTLNGSITSGDLSLIVTSATGFPGGGNFRIRIDNEIILVTAVSGTTFTILRGQEGTSAAGHSNGATVNHYLTAGALDAIRSDMRKMGTYASIPAGNKAGDTYKCTDSGYDAIYDGTNWVWFYRGHRAYPPAIGHTYAWTNQGSSTVATTDGTFTLKTVGTGSDQNRFYGITAPSMPFTLEAGMVVASSATAYSSGASNNGGYFSGISAYNGTQFVVQDISGQPNSNSPNMEFIYFNSTTSFNTSWKNQLFHNSGLVWMRILFTNATDRTCSFSLDGANYVQFLDQTGATSFTPTQVGMVINPWHSQLNGVDVYSHNFFSFRTF